MGLSDLETLVWQPSRTTLRVAAFLDIFLFVCVLAMLASYWIVVEFENCEYNGIELDLGKYWVFIETFCTEDPGTNSVRGTCTRIDTAAAKDYPPGEELYHWRAIQACVAICCAFSFIMFWLLCFGARAPALHAQQGCSKFDKRKCQEVCIAFTVIIIAFSIGTVGSLYTSDSFDPDAWVASMEETLGVTCEATTMPGPAVPMAFLSVFFSVFILGVLACPGCHCLGCHEPGKCCAKCVDQSVDAEGTSEI